MASDFSMMARRSSGSGCPENVFAARIGLRERAAVDGVGRLDAGDEQIEDRAERVDVGRLRDLARGAVLGGEVAARAPRPLSSRVIEAMRPLPSCWPADADLAVVGDPDELRDQRAVREAVAEVAQIGGRGQRERDLLGDDDGLIERDRDSASRRRRRGRGRRCGAASGRLTYSCATNGMPLMTSMV